MTMRGVTPLTPARRCGRGGWVVPGQEPFRSWGHGACAGAGVGPDQAWVPASETAREIRRASSVDGPGAGAMTARR